MGGIVGTSKEASDSFAGLTKGISTAAGTLAGLARQFVPAGTALKGILGIIQGTSVNLTTFVGSLQLLRKNDDFRAFANSFIRVFDQVEGKVKNFALSIPGVTPAINLLGSAFQKVGNFVAKIGEGVSGPTGEALKNIGLGFANIAAGAVSLAPGMDRLGSAFSLADDAAIAASKGFQAVGLQAGALGEIGTGLVLSINAVNAAITVTGTILASVGEKIVKTTADWGIAAGKSALSFAQLDDQLRATADATNINLGTADDMRKFLNDLADRTGQSETQLAQLATQFLSLENNAKLTLPQLQQLIERTVILGTQFGNLQEVSQKVIGGFSGFVGPLNRFIGLGLKSSDILKLENEGMQNLTATTSGEADAVRRAAFAGQLFDAVITGTNARVQSFNANSDNLVLALQRASGASENFVTRLGEASSKTLAPFVNALSTMLTGLKNLPGPIIDIISGLISASGTFLTIAGNVLKFAGTFVLVTQSANIFRNAMTLTLPVIGNVGEGITKLFTAFNGAAVPVKGIGSLFANLAGTIPTFIKLIDDSIGNLLISILKFPVSFGGFLRTLLTTKEGLLSLVQGFVSVGKAILVPGKLTVLIAVFVALYDAVNILNEKYGILSSITETIKSLWTDQTILGDALHFVIAKVTQATELLALLFAGALEIGILVADGALLALTKTFQLLGFLLSFIPGSVGNFGDKLRQLAADAAVAEAAVAKRLGDGLGQTGNQILEATSRLFSFDTSLGKAKKSAEETNTSIRKIAVTAALLKAVFEIAAKGLENSLKGVQASYDDQVTAVTKVAEAEKSFVDLTIENETYRASRIFEIENRLRNQIIAIQTAKYEESIALTRQNLEFELNALKETGSFSDLKQEDRIKKESEVRTKFAEQELQITEDFRKNLSTQIKALVDAENQRINIVRETRNRIKDIETQGANDVAALQLKLLKGEEANNFVRDQIRKKQQDAANLAAAGDFDRASKTADEVKSLIGQIGAADVSKIVAAAGKVGAAASLDEAQKALDSLASVTDRSSDAFQKLSSAVFFAHGPEDMQKIATAAEEFNTAIQKSAEITQINEQIDLRTRLIDIEKNIQQTRAAAAEQERTQLETTRKTLEDQFKALQDQANQLRDALANPIDVLVSFSPETAAINAAIEELRSKQIIIPVSFQTQREVDMKGFSVHPIEQVANLIQKKFAPGPIPAFFSTDTVGPAGSLLGGRGGGPSKTVRVDLNLGGEKFAVNAADDASAGQLVKFSQSLQNHMRTGGNYITPLKRGFV